MERFVHRVRNYVRMHGVGYTLRRGLEKADERVFHPYDKAWRRMRTDDAELTRQKQNPIDAGLISILIPVYNTRPELLHALVQSLTAQTYPHWEACLYDGMSTRQDTLAALEEAAAQEPRIILRHGDTNEGIAGNTARALDMAKGKWIALCDHDDLLAPDALYRVAEAILILREEPDMLYSDEDKVTEDGACHTDPHFKPDFSPDTLRSCNYICHLLVARRTLLDKVGGFRPGFDGSQDHDLALRLAEQAEKIVHIPHVLYHWRIVGSSMSHQNLARCVDAGCCAVQEHLDRIGLAGRAEPCGSYIRVRYDVKEETTVRAIIIGRADQAAKCAERLMADGWPNLTWTAAENRAQASRLAEAASEDVLLFADASVRIVPGNFVRELLMFAQRDDVGAAVPQLMDRWGRALPGAAAENEGLRACRKAGLPRRLNGWGRMMLIAHNAPSVDMSCVMIRRNHFVPFCDNDGDGTSWQKQLSDAGLHHVHTPFARAVK